MNLKGTVSRDFRPSFFFIKTSVLGSWLRGLSLFEYKFEFAKIFEFFLNACGVIDTACTQIFLNNFEKWKSNAKQRWYAKKCKMYTVSMTPHARCIRCHWYRMNDACSVIDTAYTYACGVIDTACTIDQRFERPWQPLKGTSIKNIYVPEFSYPTTKKYGI
jgi:hypothetical protein